MASVDKSSDATNIDDNAATDSSSSCLNDPNYAIICVFLQKFGGQLKIEHPDFIRLQKMIENSDEVHDELRQFFVKLLRKTRKSVQPDKLDSALAKFCYTYSAQDAWEVERFGYKKSSLSVKLRILKEVLESQFDKNPNFRALVTAQTAAELRSQPLGKDKLGNAYWSTIDGQCNLRIYQEHLDEEIWKVVATNRDEMAKLIACLKGNELVMPSLVGLIDEDSSSNSMPPKVDALQNENGTSNGTTTNGNDSDDKNVPCLKIKLNAGADGESTVEKISNGDNTNGAKNLTQNETADDEEEEDASIMSEIDELSLAASESSNTTAGTKSNETQGSKRISLLASKPPSNANKLKLRIFSTGKKTNKRNLDEDSDTVTSKSKRQSIKKDTTEDDSEYESEELSDEEYDENDISGDDDVVGPAIEEPTLYVQGEGSGTDNNCENILWPDSDEQSDENEVGEEIVEDVFYVTGEGSGQDCDVGNNDTTETPESSTTTVPPPPPIAPKKPMFFFGQAGCLKLSPMKPSVVTTDNSSVSAENKNESEDKCPEENENESEKNQESSSSISVNENDTVINDTKNSVALDAKNDSKPENTANDDKIDTDETDKGISANNEPLTLTKLPQNNIDDKHELKQSTSSSSNDCPATSKIDTNETNIVAEVKQISEVIINESVTENESSKENIESNSSVALVNISVQDEEKNETVEQESLPSTSEVLLQTKTHLSNNTIKESEISVICQETKSTEPDLECNDVNLIVNEPQSQSDPEPENTANKCSEIEVNETNVLKNENQSSLSKLDSDLGVESKPSTASDDVPIENQTPISSKNSEIVDDNTNMLSNRVQESEDSKTSIENIVEKPSVKKIIAEEEKEQVSKQDNEESNIKIDKEESNNDVKTDLAIEQNEPNELEINLSVQESSDQINLVDTPPVKKPSDLPDSVENAIELSKALSEERETEESISAKASPEQPDTLSIPENKTLPLKNEETEQKPCESIESTSIQSELAPIETITKEPLPEIAIESTPSKPLPSKIETVEPAPIEPDLSDSISNESTSIDSFSESTKPIECGSNENSIESESVVPSISIDVLKQLVPSTSKKTQQVESKPEQNEIINLEVSPAPMTEKRKSIDKIEEPSELNSKKVCEEKILEEPQQPAQLEVNTVVIEKINETPLVSKIDLISTTLDVVVPIESVDIAKTSLEVKAQEIETAKESELIVKPEEELSTDLIEEDDDSLKIDEANKSNEVNETETSILKSDLAPDDNVLNEKLPEEKVESLSTITEKNDATTIVEKTKKALENEPPIPETQENQSKPTIERPVVNKKEKSPIPVQTESSRSTQLKNRKRRMSGGEKTRNLSESDDNIDSLVDSPLSQDASSEEEVGGKRIKMRPKVQVRRTTRKSVEQKRNIKDTEWSSDENDMPNAKRATGDISKAAENVLPSPGKIIAKVEHSKSPVKDEIVKEEKPEIKTEIKSEEPCSVIEESKLKAEEEPADQSDEEQATPSRRPGRPARRGRKPGPKPKAAKPVEEVKTDDDKTQDKTLEEIKEEPNEIKEEKSTPATRRKKRSLMGLDMADVETIQAAAENDAPVRQSRRIAQIKIREEAERRKAEEVALTKMKEASEKKKKGVFTKQSASEEENSESEAKLEKKKRRKKGNKDKPWQTDSDDPSERDEEDHDEHEDVERLEPLRSDHEFSPESDIEDESQIVPTKRARTARKDKNDRREEESEEEEADIHACQKCSKSDHPEWILLCDKCDKGYHCSCLNPVLFVIPEGNWFCPPCQQEKLIDELEIKLTEFDNLIKQREIEEAQRQRLLLTTISEQNVLRDTKRDRQRARNKDLRHSDDSSESSSSEDSEAEQREKRNTSERRTRPRPRPNRQRNRSESSEQSESSDNSSDNEPIYKLRKRRQANVSYRFNEYDELINRAIKSEMDEVAGAGNLGRGKDIATIMEADKEEKRLKKLEQQQKERELAGDTVKEKDDDDSDDQPLKIKGDKSDGSDSEPIRPKAIKRSKNSGRKKKKLNSLDDDSDDADSSDDDFNTSSYSDEDEDSSSAASDSSLDSIVKKRRKGRGITTRRSGRERKKRYDADFIDDSSFDDEDNVPLVKKKKKVESDFSDFDGSSEELEEDVDSEDLCEDSTDDSDKSWGKKKSKSKSFNKSNSNKNRKAKSDVERSLKVKPIKKKSKISDDESEDDDEEGDEVLPKSRRTRGKKLPYLLDVDFDSSDDGIKPGVKRPDTPPEERAAFIKKQEEIKRMLAEKGGPENNQNVPQTKDSLSTIPPSIIQSAKALDVDLKKTATLQKNASDNDSNGFDDDLPEDFDPEDMDEDAIAKMMEEEEFAQHQLKLAGETIRNRKLKDALTKDDSPTKLTIETAPSVIMQPNLPPSLVSPLPLSTSQLTIPDIPPSMYTAQFQATNSKTTPKKRGRKTKDDILPIPPKEALQSQPHLQIPTIPPNASVLPQPSIKPNTLLNIPSVLQHAPPSQLFSAPTIQHTSSVIAHASVIQQQQQRLPSMPPSASSILGIVQNREPIIPSTVLDVQNTRLLDPSELGKPPDDLLDPATKKQRPRSRKKITPTRESLITSPPNVTVTPGISQPTPVTIPNVPIVSKPPSSILSERLTANPADKSSLSIATPPQLYSPSSRSQASVITRLARPPQGRQPFPSGQSSPQRYFAPNAPLPPHSIASTGSGTSHSRPYHSPNVTVASGPRPPTLVPPPHASGHLPHPMYMRGQPGIYGGPYPNIQPPPMHRSLQSIEHASNSPQNFTGPYQNLSFGSYYAAAAAAERRTGAIIGTFEPFDNKNPSSHDRLPAYAHPGLSSLAALANRNPISGGDGDDERSAPPGAGGAGSSEFSGLVSYFSSQQDDLDA